MILGRSRIGFAVLLYMIVLLGVTMGAEVGYDANSTTGTQIEYTGESLIIGDEERELNTTIETDDSPDSEFGRIVQDGVIDFTETLLHASFTMAFTVADYTASLVYVVSPIVPRWVVGGVLNIAAIVPVAGVGYVCYTRLSKVVA